MLQRAHNAAESAAAIHMGWLVVSSNPLISQSLPYSYFFCRQDMKCSFVGPSSLFQRWNLHVRSGYNFFNDDDNAGALTHWLDCSPNYALTCSTIEEIDFPTNNVKRILVIDRTYDGVDALYSSRRIQNITGLMTELSLQLGYYLLKLPCSVFWLNNCLIRYIKWLWAGKRGPCSITLSESAQTIRGV